MSIWPILLRILLTAGLILNGSGYAAASTHAHAGAAGPAAAGAAACHGDGIDAAVPGHSPAVSGKAHATVHVDAPPPSPDDCQTDDCGCSCAQQSAVAVITGVHGRDAVIARERGIGVMASGRASPALPNPIRPPIG